jgi:hypothetical protein
MYRVEIAKLLAVDAAADPEDAALFRTLWSDDGGDRSPAYREDASLDSRPETYEARPHRHDDVPRSPGRQGSLDRREGESRDAASADALNVAALSGVVAKVYLDGLQDRKRAVHLAMDQGLLPATRLSVQEREGRLAIDFISVNSTARGRLRKGASTLADRVARDLSRDVAVTVAAHEDDRLALKVCSLAPGGGGAP